MSIIATLQNWDALTPELIAGLSRLDAIAWLAWNDRNGSYTDEDCRADGIPEMSRRDACDALAECRFEDEPSRALVVCFSGKLDAINYVLSEAFAFPVEHPYARANFGAAQATARMVASDLLDAMHAAGL